MKKFLLSLALVLGLSSAASAVVIPGEGEAWNTYSWTESKDSEDNVIKYETTAQGYTLTLDKGTSSSDLSVANPATTNQIRVYVGSNLTISGTAAFTKVTVTVASNSKAVSATASEGWTLKGEVTTSKNSTFSFVSATPQTTITFDGDGKQLRLSALEILAEGEAPVNPDPVDPVDISNTAETAYTTSQAFELITAGQGLDTEVYVKGTIKEVTEISTSYGNATYTLTDGTSDLVVFRGLYIDGEKFTAEDQIAVGQELIILGKLVNYNGTYEVTTGSKIISINGDAPVNPDPVDPDPEEPGEYTSLELLDPTDSATPIVDGGITIEGDLPEGLSYIWAWKSYNSSYFLKASAFANSTKYAATSYAWTPAFTPVNGTVVTAEFEHAYKFESNASSLWKFVVREEGSSEITELTIPEWGTGSDFTFVSSGSIDLSAFIGKKIQVGFKYVSSTESAGTWEVHSLVLSTDGDFDVDLPEEQDVVVNNIAEALELCTTESTPNVVINNPVTVVYQNGRYLWVNDATGNILLYGDINDIYIDGDVIPAGIKGTAINYSQGQFQLKDLDTESFLEATPGTPVAPIEIAVEELSPDLVNQYVVIAGATIAVDETAEKDNTYILTDETGSCTLFNQFWNEAYYDVVDVPEGSDITVYAMVNVYKGVAQLYPVRFDGGIEKVAAPEFSIEGGQVLKGTQVALTSATEGATIHYTIDGSEPTSTSTVYSEPIILVFDVTIKAIAVKEGMNNSDVNEATFTVVEPVEGNEAYFPFATVDPSNYGFDMTDHSDYTKAQTISVVDQPITVAPATITISKGASAQGGAFYRPQDQEDRESFWTLRFYKKAIMTISAMGGYEITSVSFEFEDEAKHRGYLAKCDFSTGNYNTETYTWTGSAQSLVIDGLNNDGGTVSFKSITVNFDVAGSALDIEANQDAPVEYFNLQGVRINGELTPGLYIRRQGTATSKVIIR